ncbi:hypothetical protein VNO77_18887 [Canavalia gladiata]|uniref:Uncharacterized protein n=1 Tax=Canavalia gladiata TaxID=3824 RepID=A0AAN9QP37_CANGL
MSSRKASLGLERTIQHDDPCSCRGGDAFPGLSLSDLISALRQRTKGQEGGGHGELGKCGEYSLAGASKQRKAKKPFVLAESGHNSSKPEYDTGLLELKRY